MSSVKIEKATRPVEFGEGPHWDDDNQVLYYVDITGSRAHRFDPATGDNTAVSLETAPHFIIPVKGTKDKFVVGGGHDISVITWDGKSSKPQRSELVVTVDREHPDNKINDAKADARGRLWSGTMGPFVDGQSTPGDGIMFSVNNSRSVEVHLTGVGLSNGLGWSPDNTTMYYADTLVRSIYAFDFDLDTGKTSNKRTVFTFEGEGIKGMPDGMTVDVDGNLWVAFFANCQVVKLDPVRGERLTHLDFPCEVTSVTWGGRAKDELYVTSGALKEEKKDPHPDAGAIFKVTGLGTRGLPSYTVQF